MKRLIGGVLGGVTAVLLLAACGQSAVVDAVPAASPYEGPLCVEVTAAPDDEKADRTGAAGLAVDCDTTPIGYTEPDPYENSVSRSPTAALERGLKEPNRGADSGLREARREDDRVLHVYEVDRRIKQAVIVHRGTAIDGSTGWYVESWARCDWAELPAALADELGLQVWTDNSGRRVPTTRVASAPGPEHCSWEDMTFLSTDGGDLDGSSLSLIAAMATTFWRGHPSSEASDGPQECWTQASAAAALGSPFWKTALRLPSRFQWTRRFLAIHRPGRSALLQHITVGPISSYPLC